MFTVGSDGASISCMIRTFSFRAGSLDGGLSGVHGEGITTSRAYCSSHPRSSCSSQLTSALRITWDDSDIENNEI